MLSTKLKEAAGNSADATLYVDDVFSTYLYTGNGSTQTITNGIDLAGKGGMIWTKSRNLTNNNNLVNTVSGVGKSLASNNTAMQQTQADQVTAFNSDGYSLGADAVQWEVNRSGYTYASWTFRKAAKFFDVVTYTGTGSAQTIAHSLGVAPGMIIVKRTDASGYSWVAWNRGLSTNNSLKLNTTDGEILSAAYIPTAGVTSTSFQVGGGSLVSDPGTYVAYLFAHDTSSTGIIQCGSFTADGTGTGTVTLGWEPQYIMVKKINASNNWAIDDSMRGWNVSGQDSYLLPNSSVAEGLYEGGYPTATGFVNLGGYTAGDNLIYMAIRMPNKPPTSGTQVFSPNAVTDDSVAATTNFPVDMAMENLRTGYSANTLTMSRLTGGGQFLKTASTAAESSAAAGAAEFQSNTSITPNLLGAGSLILYNFKRAPGFFDEVCYTGNSVQGRTITHNLGAKPELMIVKSRSNNPAWQVYSATETATKYMLLNSSQSSNTASFDWNDTEPTSSVFTIQGTGGTGLEVNWTGYTYVAYLFATLAGISKVGSYTGNGSTQNINCGFAAGARFFLVKATSTTGSWWVWDSARGITAGNDPALQLNSTAAEITTADAVDPYSPGITVNQEATCSINASGVSYVYLAIS